MQVEVDGESNRHITRILVLLSLLLDPQHDASRPVKGFEVYLPGVDSWWYLLPIRTRICTLRYDVNRNTNKNISPTKASTLRRPLELEEAVEEELFVAYELTDDCLSIPFELLRLTGIQLFKTELVYLGISMGALGLESL